MRMRFTKRGKAFVVRNFYTHVKTDWVNRDKAVLPDFARPEIPKNVAPIQKLQDAFYAISTLDASTVFRTQTMYAHTKTPPHTHIRTTNPYMSTVNRYSCVT